jgi:hypothetical protein
MNISRFAKSALSGRLIRGSPIALAAASMVFGATSLKASCFDPATSRQGATLKPEFVQILAERQGRDEQSNSIVGLWHVTYTDTTNRGVPFYEAFDMWHSDGLEFENANLSPIESNICMGVWKLMGHNIRLYHVGWSFDATGSPTGIFTINETNTVSVDGNSYTGTFAFKQYDPDGNLIFEIDGTIDATRITVH